MRPDVGVSVDIPPIGVQDHLFVVKSLVQMNDSPRLLACVQEHRLFAFLEVSLFCRFSLKVQVEPFHEFPRLNHQVSKVVVIYASKDHDGNLVLG